MWGSLAPASSLGSCRHSSFQFPGICSRIFWPPTLEKSFPSTKPIPAWAAGTVLPSSRSPLQLGVLYQVTPLHLGDSSLEHSRLGQLPPLVLMILTMNCPLVTSKRQQKPSEYIQLPQSRVTDPLADLALYANNKWQYLPNKWATEGRGMTQLSKRSGYGMGFEIFASFYSKGIFSFLMSSSLPFSSKVRKLLKTKPFVVSGQLLEAMELPLGGKQNPFVTMSSVVWVLCK